MQRISPATIVLAALFPLAASAAGPDAATSGAIDRLIERGLADGRALELVEGLTTEIGPRLGGTDAEARARDWSVAHLKKLGFDNVRIETFDMPAWRRVVERVEIVAPFAQPLTATALGNSPSTPEGGVEGEVVRFESLRALKDAPATGLEGKILFVDERMTRTQDGSGYGAAVAKRTAASIEAARRGAAAALIRSVGTDEGRRAPHAGNMAITEGAAFAPAAALSHLDADQLARAIRRARGPVRLRVDLRTEKIEKAQSGNVVAEIKGRTDEIVVIGGHLDSWDLSPGALDDAAGIAITTAAAKLVDELPGKPRRTIRLVFWGAEEVGLHGARAYAAAHQGEIARHVFASESDFGAGRVWRAQTGFGAGAAAAVGPLFFEALARLGVGTGDNKASGGPDVGPLRAAGVPTFSLNQDGSDYFDHHHTPEDTFDKIDPEALRQNVAAWAATLYLASELAVDFRAGDPAP